MESSSHRPWSDVSHFDRRHSRFFWNCSLPGSIHFCIPTGEQFIFSVCKYLLAAKLKVKIVKVTDMLYKYRNLYKTLSWGRRILWLKGEHNHNNPTTGHTLTS